MKEDGYYIELIQKLEPVFLEAGELAIKLQSKVSAKKKLATGTYEIDVVTDADLKVQEAILSALAKTELSQCWLVAEEKTESAAKFNQDGETLLGLDPIDGTSRYAAGAPIYSLIVSIQKSGRPLYTFVYYPAIGWTHRFIGKIHQESGPRPVLSVRETFEMGSNRVIVYSSGNPKRKVPAVVRQELNARGYAFINRKELTSDCGATTLLLAGKVKGYYCEDPQVVDGLVGLHYALAHQYEIQREYRERPEPGLGGVRYSGYYFVLRK